MASEAVLRREALEQVGELRARGSWFRGLWNFVRRKPLGAFGMFVIAIMVSAAILTYLGLADDITGYRYDHQVLSENKQGPSAKHIFGTDQNGRDLFSRIFYGSRVSITIGFGAVAISQTLAAAMGIVSGYYGGKFDFLFQRIVDIWQALPGLLALIFLASVFGTGDQTQRTIVLIIAIGVLGAPAASRLVRGTVISVRQNQYVEAAVMLGASDFRILTRHILPNIVHIILISATVGIGGAILVESALAFLGFGLPPPYPTWGQMLDKSREYVTYPWLAIWPGLALTLTVFAFNIVGDALRDVWDPRLRGSR
ncbi:MAG TPA: ABC transporter permease [Dehalococcoidia bacterium]|nr:ABC transporter permease [Dehalococcoidia bacterium]